MACKLYVGNLPFDLKDQQVLEIFSEAGEVGHVKLVTDPFDGRSRGFGFIEMKTEEGAKDAIAKFDGFEIDGRKLRVLEAKSQQTERNKARGKLSGGPRPGGSYQQW